MDKELYRLDLQIAETKMLLKMLEAERDLLLRTKAAAKLAQRSE